MITENKEEKLKKTAKKTSERTTAENIDKLVISLGKEGYTPSQIGIILREKHSIPKAKLLGKKITKILKENNLEYSNDLDLVNKKIKRIENHYSKNNQDKRAKREIVRFVGLRKKLEKYLDKKER